MELETVPKSLRQQIVDDIRQPAIAMVGDAVLFFMGIFILAASYFCLFGLQLLHYPAKYSEKLELLHFWGFFAVLFVLLLDLILKIGAHALKKK